MAVHAPSAIGVAHPSLLNFPVPFGPTLADLQDAAYSYAGVLANPPVLGRVSKTFTLWPSSSVLRLHASPGTLTLWPSPNVLTGGDE